MNPAYQHYATHDESDFPHLWRGVVGAWAPCLGPSGTRLHDHSGRANWGTLTNMDAATDWVVDGGQYALNFDGVNDFVEIADSPVLSAVMPITLCFWCNPTTLPPASNANRMFLVTKGAAANYEWDATINWFNGFFGKFTFYYATLNGASYYGQATATSAVAGQWQFVAFIQSSFSSFPNAYYNGKLDNGGTFSAGSGSAGDGTAPVRIGARGDNAELEYAGRMSDIVLYNRVLSANEIAELYQIGRGGMYTPRRRRRAYSFGPSFLAAWARGSNVILQPCGVS